MYGYIWFSDKPDPGLTPGEKRKFLNAGLDTVITALENKSCLVKAYKENILKERTRLIEKFESNNNKHNYTKIDGIYYHRQAEWIKPFIEKAQSIRGHRDINPLFVDTSFHGKATKYTIKKSGLGLVFYYVCLLKKGREVFIEDLSRSLWGFTSKLAYNNGTTRFDLEDAFSKVIFLVPELRIRIEGESPQRKK